MTARDDSCRAAATVAHGTPRGGAKRNPSDNLMELRSRRAYGSLSDWADPRMDLVQDEFHAPPFPKQILGGVGNLAQDVSDAVGASIDYFVGPVLAASSACIGNARSIRVGPTWSEPAVWWHTSIGEPSSGKSPAQEKATEPLTQIDREMRAASRKQRDRVSRAREEARIRLQLWRAEARKALREGRKPPPKPKAAEMPDLPAPSKLVLVDINTEGLEAISAGNLRGVFIKRDELSGLFFNLSRFGSRTLGPVMLSAFNAADHDVSRAGGKSLYIPRLNISLTGLITPDDWGALLARPNDGLLARLCAVHPRSVGLPATDRVPDLARLERMYRRLLALDMPIRGGVPKPKELPLARAAQALRQEWHAEHHRCQEEGFVGAHYGKLPAIELRLALLLELIWWAYGEDGPEPMMVSEAAMAAALGAVEAYYKPMAKRVYGVSGLSPRDARARALARYILRKRLTVINLRVIGRSAGLPGIRTPLAAKDAAKVLQDDAWLRPAPYRGRGRPDLDFEVNPLVFAMEVGQ